MDEGAVPKAIVVRVLEACLDPLGTSMKLEGNELLLIKDEIPEVVILPDEVPRSMLRRFAYKYGVKIEFFYHPEMCVKGNDTNH